MFTQQDQKGPFCGAVGTDLCLLQPLASVEFHRSAAQPAVPKRPAGTGGERATRHGHRMARLNVPKTQSADQYVADIFTISAILSTAQARAENFLGLHASSNIFISRWHFTFFFSAHRRVIFVNSGKKQCILTLLIGVCAWEVPFI